MELVVFTTEDKNVEIPLQRIRDECLKYDKAIIRVERYDEQREISRKQMAYLHAVVFPILAEAMSCSLWEAEYTCKRWCGEQWELIKKVGPQMYVETSKTKLTVKQCSDWIESIMDWADKRNIHIPPPDQDWYAKRNQKTKQ